MRLQKYIAAAGIASRRAAEEIIVSGRVSVNKEIITKLGTVIDPANDIVHIDNKLIKFEEKKLFLFHKPKGVISSLKDPHHKIDLQKYIKKTGVRAYPVGRLDRDAFGLMLLTNDGETADILLHPKYEVERVYLLLVEGSLSEASIKKAKQGIELVDGLVKAKLKKVSFSAELETFFEKPKNSFSIVSATLLEGRKHIVKRLMARLGNPVQELCRYSHGKFSLGNLRPGEVIEVKNYKDLL